MKRKVSFIYFDIGGVLLDWRQSVVKISALHGVSTEAIYDVIESHWDVVGRGGDTALYSQALATLLKLPAPYQDAVDFWTDHHIVIEETHNFAVELKQQYKLGLLTNAEKNAMTHAHKKGLLPNISWDAIVDSSKHGVIKPEPAIYEIAERLAGVPKEQILFIDDMEENISAAVARGWQGIVFDTKHPKESIAEIKKKLT